MSSKPRKGPAIGTLNEKPLHAALKEWCAEPGDRFEVEVEGFVVDIVRGDALVEIQTQGLWSMKRKLLKLTEQHCMRVVYPIAREKWIVKLSKDGKRGMGRRKSPKRGAIEDVFEELVSIPKLAAEPNFVLEVLLTEEEEVRRRDVERGWRLKGWVREERRLLGVAERRVLETPSDFCGLLPSTVEEPFTTSDIAAAMGKPLWLARQIAYCLREMEAIAATGKRGNAILYERAVA